MANYKEHWEQLLDVFEEVGPDCCSLRYQRGYIKDGKHYTLGPGEYPPQGSDDFVGYCDGGLSDLHCEGEFHLCAVWCKAYIEIHLLGE